MVVVVCQPSKSYVPIDIKTMYDIVSQPTPHNLHAGFTWMPLNTTCLRQPTLSTQSVKFLGKSVVIKILLDNILSERGILFVTP